MTGLDNGNMILQKTPISEHPSIFAASSNSSGIFSKKLFTIIKLNGLIATGKIKAQIESSNPKFFTTTYVGIIPPLKTMVKITKFKNRFLPPKCFWESGYAIVNVSDKLTSVPKTVIKTDTPILLKKVVVEKIYS